MVNVSKMLVGSDDLGSWRGSEYRKTFFLSFDVPSCHLLSNIYFLHKRYYITSPGWNFGMQ